MEEHNLVAIDTAFRPLIGHTYERMMEDSLLPGRTIF